MARWTEQRIACRYAGMHQFHTFFYADERVPHHGRLFYVMRHVGLWLPVTLGLQIGDVERDPSLIRVVRGWSDQGEYSIPRKDGRGFIQLGEHAPTRIPIGAHVLTRIDEQIADLERRHHPTGKHDWLFPGRSSGHPWNPGVLSHMVLQPALRKMGLPPVTPKNLYYSIMRLRVHETMMERATCVRVQPSPSCTDPSCPRQRSQSHPPSMGGPLIPDIQDLPHNPA